jgi:hypothetical protein
MSDIKSLSGGNVPLEIFHHNPQPGEVWQVNDPFYSAWNNDEMVTVLVLKIIDEDKIEVLNPNGIDTMYLWVFNKDAKKIC